MTWRWLTLRAAPTRTLHSWNANSVVNVQPEARSSGLSGLWTVYEELTFFLMSMIKWFIRWLLWELTKELSNWIYVLIIYHMEREIWRNLNSFCCNFLSQLLFGSFLFFFVVTSRLLPILLHMHTPATTSLLAVPMKNGESLIPLIVPLDATRLAMERKKQKSSNKHVWSLWPYKCNSALLGWKEGSVQEAWWTAGWDWWGQPVKLVNLPMQ